MSRFARTFIINFQLKSQGTNIPLIHNENQSRNHIDNEFVEALEGRISLWIKNDTAFYLRVGQADTDEVIALSPGMNLAYR